VNSRAQKARSNRELLFRITSVILSLGVALLLGEIALRVLPIPGMQFEYHTYDDLIGTGHYPNSTVTYRDDRGTAVKRKINRWGYLDADHGRDKPRGVYRIGFFGDSYTEARQVPVDSTFSRIVEREMGGDSIETLAFGIMGIGTVHEYLLSTRETARFDVEMVVYVFYENDPVDNLRDGTRSEPRLAFASLLGDSSIEVNTTFREHNGFRRTWYYRVYDWAMARSLLRSTVRLRLGHLVRHGVKLRVTDDDRAMVSGESEVPWRPLANGVLVPDGQGGPPSTWPAPSLDYAAVVCEKLILQWRDEITAQSRQFAILYMPRYREWAKPTLEQDTWKGWLEAVAAEHGIELIDPFPELLEATERGERVLWNHLTSSGHQAVAKAFVGWFKSGRAVAAAESERTHSVSVGAKP
jgi:hypothetical protein